MASRSFARLHSARLLSIALALAAATSAPAFAQPPNPSTSALRDGAADIRVRVPGLRPDNNAWDGMTNETRNAAGLFGLLTGLEGANTTFFLQSSPPDPYLVIVDLASGELWQGRPCMNRVDCVTHHVTLPAGDFAVLALDEDRPASQPDLIGAAVLTSGPPLDEAALARAGETVADALARLGVGAIDPAQIGTPYRQVPESFPVYDLDACIVAQACPIGRDVVGAPSLGAGADAAFLVFAPSAGAAPVPAPSARRRPF